MLGDAIGVVGLDLKKITLSCPKKLSTCNIKESGLQRTIGEGSGGGSVGRAVASDTRDPRFESQHRQTLSTNCTLKRRK